MSSSGGSDSTSNSSHQTTPPSKSSSHKVLPVVPPSSSTTASRSRTIRPLPSAATTTTGSSKGSLPYLPTQDNLGANTHRLVSANKSTPLDYDQFAQVMTTSPSLLSALYTQRLLSTSELDEMAFALYQFSSTLSTSCFMNKILIGIEFERSSSDTGNGMVIMRGNTVATKVMDNIVKAEAVDYLKNILIEPLKKIILDEALDLEIDPTKVMSRIESDIDISSKHIEGLGHQEASMAVTQNLEHLSTYCRYFLDRMLSQKSLETMPFNIRYICKIINEMCHDKYRIDNSETIIGSFVFLRLFNPTIIYPESRDILPPEVKIHSKHRRNLVLISKVIQQIANGFEFGAKEGFMIPLNPLINEYIQKAKKFLVECSELDSDKILNDLEKNVPEKVKNKIISSDEKLLQHAMNVQMLVKTHEKTLQEKSKDLIGVLNRLPKIEDAIRSESSIISNRSDSVGSSSTTNLSTTNEKKYQDSEKYLELLEKAKQEDIRDLEAMNVISCRTCDSDGRPVIIFSEEKIKKEDLERTLLYMILKLDKFVERDYIMIWCVSNSTSQSRPGFSWMLNVYKTITRKYKKNLKSLYIVHPTMMIKVIMKCFSPFVSEKFWKKLHLADTIQDIFKDIPESTLPLPPTVIAYDLMQNNIKSNQPSFFSTSLEELIKTRKDCVNSLIPPPIKKCMDFLKEQHADTKGIFRISGNQATVNQLKILINHGSNVDLHHVDCHVLASLIKLFFRELPDPLFMFSVYDELISIVKENGNSVPDVIEGVKKVIPKMPPCHYELAKDLFALLNHVQSLSEENMMNAHNLAIVLGPNIIRSNSPNPLLALQDNGPLTYVTEIMIGHFEQIFQIQSSSNQQQRGGTRRPQALMGGDLEKLKSLNFDEHVE